MENWGDRPPGGQAIPDRDLAPGSTLAWQGWGILFNKRQREMPPQAWGQSLPGMLLQDAPSNCPRLGS